MPISNPEGLWIKSIPMKRIENEHGWAELTVLYETDGDQKTGYFDILVGRKSEKGWHIHAIISLGGKIIDLQSRGVTQSVTQKIESELQGKIAEESIILKPTTPKLPVDVVINYKGSTKEVTIDDFRFKNSVIFE